MDILLLIIGLLFVVALMLLLAWGVQKLNLHTGQNFINQKAAQEMTIKEQLYLDPKRRIVKVETKKKAYLILLGPDKEQIIDQEDIES